MEKDAFNDYDNDLYLEPEPNEISVVDLVNEIDTDNQSQFRKDLEHLINCNCMENGSDTPDFILAEYLSNCLKAFDSAVKQRTKWYSSEIEIEK